MPAHDLANKHVVIVGGSSGMGLALAKLLVAAGARLTLVGRDAAKVKGVAMEIGNAEGRSLDLRRAETIPPAFDGISDVDHLVITAGTTGPMPLASTGPDQWRGPLEERIIGPLTIIKALAPRLKTSIVMFSGTGARRPTAGRVATAAAAGGVENMVRSLALELSPIRVNAVLPGMVDTPMLEGVLGEHKAKVTADTAAKLPAKRIGQPEDPAQAAIFLMTNPFMNGTSIVIDGGGLLI